MRPILLLLVAIVTVGTLWSVYYEQRSMLELIQPLRKATFSSSPNAFQLSTVPHTAPPTELRNDTLTIDPKQSLRVLCIDDKAYGQSFNMILTIAAARTIAFELTKELNESDLSIGNTSSTSSPTVVKVGLGLSFSDFYNATLEPLDDILLYYIPSEDRKDETVCHYKYVAEEVFRNFLQMNWYVDSRVQHLQTLIPKHSIREHAMSYLRKFQPPTHSSDDGSKNSKHAIITTVHRRNFENKCRQIVQNRKMVLCLDHRTGNLKTTSFNFFSAVDLVNYCNLNYTMIQSDLRDNNNDSIPNTVLLCTDRQAPKYDKTFPHVVSITPESPHENKKIDKSIMVVTEAWIMTLSDIHYGNPMSTVDAVVSVWRNNPHMFPEPLSQPHDPAIGTHPHPREMRPMACYGSEES
jgi:hypothetical protein